MMGDAIKKFEARPAIPDAVVKAELPIVIATSIYRCGCGRTATYLVHYDMDHKPICVMRIMPVDLNGMCNGLFSYMEDMIDAANELEAEQRFPVAPNAEGTEAKQ